MTEPKATAVLAELNTAMTAAQSADLRAKRIREALVGLGNDEKRDVNLADLVAELTRPYNPEVYADRVKALRYGLDKLRTHAFKLARLYLLVEERHALLTADAARAQVDAFLGPDAARG